MIEQQYHATSCHSTRSVVAVFTGHAIVANTPKIRTVVAPPIKAPNLPASAKTNHTKARHAHATGVQPTSVFHPRLGCAVGGAIAVKTKAAPIKAYIHKPNSAETNPGTKRSVKQTNAENHARAFAH